MPRATKARDEVGEGKPKPTAVLSHADQLVEVNAKIVEAIYADAALMAQMKKDLGIHG